MILLLQKAQIAGKSFYYPCLNHHSFIFVIYQLDIDAINFSN